MSAFFKFICGVVFGGVVGSLAAQNEFFFIIAFVFWVYFLLKVFTDFFI